MATTQEYIEACEAYLDELSTCLDEGDIDSARELIPVLSFAIESIGDGDD